MNNDVPGLMAGLSILRMVPVIAHTNRRRSDRLTRISTICLRGNMLERWAYSQLAKISALSGRDAEEGTPRYFWDTAGEVASLACLPSFRFTGSRMDDVQSLSLEFRAACDDLVNTAGLGKELAGLHYNSSIESAESGFLDSDRVDLESARDPVLEYTGLRLEIVNGYPERERLASLIARAGEWGTA